MENEKTLESLMKAVDDKAMYGELSKHYFQWLKGSATLAFYVEDEMKWALHDCEGNPQKVKNEIRELFQHLEKIVIEELKLDELISRRNLEF